jgi:hypothetical protein
MHTLEYLGCSAVELHTHLDRKMHVWNSTHVQQMTLGNIHVDHIKPCATATSLDQVAELSHFTNLQPLLAADNLAKTANWGPLDELFWRTNIKGNTDYNDIYWPLACPPNTLRSV